MMQAKNNSSDVLMRELFLSAVLGLWERGFDTWQMAKILTESQAHVERALHEALEIKRRERNAKKNT